MEILLPVACNLLTEKTPAGGPCPCVPLSLSPAGSHRIESWCQSPRPRGLTQPCRAGASKHSELLALPSLLSFWAVGHQWCL